MSEKGKMTVYLDEDKPSFLVLQRGIEATNAIVQTNLGGEPIRVTDLDRAVNPAGKSTKWEIPGLGDEAEQVGEITASVQSVLRYLPWVRRAEAAAAEDTADAPGRRGARRASGGPEELAVRS